MSPWTAAPWTASTAPSTTSTPGHPRDSEWVHVKTKLGLVFVGCDEALKDPAVWSSNALQLAIELAAPAAAATLVGKGGGCGLARAA